MDGDFAIGTLRVVAIPAAVIVGVLLVRSAMRNAHRRAWHDVFGDAAFLLLFATTVWSAVITPDPNNHPVATTAALLGIACVFVWGYGRWTIGWRTYIRVHHGHPSRHRDRREHRPPAAAHPITRHHHDA